jgi:uncharacterized membrane protein YdjX (TVP38/TMEM64 family)
MTSVLTLLNALAATHGVEVVIIFVIVRGLCVVCPPTPGLPIDLAAIGLFGLSTGLGLAEVGIMLGATMAFAVGRHARNSAEGQVGSRLLVLGDRVSRSTHGEDGHNQFLWWFSVRLVTNPLFGALSYAAGLSESRFGSFFFGTFLGNVPSMSLFFLAESYAMASGVGALIVVTMLFGLIIWYVGDRWLTYPTSPPIL